MAQIRYCNEVVGNFQLNGFATGGYSNKCRECCKEFIGDKRAVLCLECAINRVEENLNSLQQLKAEIAKILHEYYQAKKDGWNGISNLLNSLQQLSAVE